MQSVELLLDPVGSDRVVAQWDALAAAGLPSQAQHLGPTNAPHITIGLADTIDGEAEAALGDVAGFIPLSVHVGSMVLFQGKSSVVLARMVLASPELLALHEAVTKALEQCPGQVEHLAVGRWVPHVTLARRLKSAAIPHALSVLKHHESSLAPGLEVPGGQTFGARAVALRRWDSQAKRAWTLTGRRPTDGG
ncbi:MAG: 2'-5' RNA ligase family protein [Ornithinimicrobium sp.]